MLSVGQCVLQDVVLFKSGYESHVRQQERIVPAIPAWLESWAPMQDCKVKQVCLTCAMLPHILAYANTQTLNSII